MGNLLIFVGVSYAVALFVQMLCYQQSVRKAKSVEEESLEATLMTPQNV